MRQISLAERIGAAKVTSALVTLNNLDRIWTKSLEKRGSIAATDVPTLKALVARMDALLAEIPDEFDVVVRAIADNPDGCDAAYKDTLASHSLAVEQRNRVHQVVGRAGSLVALAQQASAGLRKLFPEEREILKEKLDMLSHGKGATGDLRQENCCNIGAGIMIGGLFTADPFLFGVGAGILLACDC